MKRREFLKQAALTAATVASTSQMHASGKTPSNPIAKRTLGKTGEKLSMIGFGGIVVMDESPDAAANVVAEAVDRGINYFDIAPSYGNAQERLGPALAPYRKNVFLACKTEGRTKDESRKQLEESLRLLKTDHVDLYQFHALTKMKELDQVLGPGGAMETMEAAKKEGKIRYIGFSVHSQETALAALDRYNFDTILFPVNWVLFTQAEFGPKILKRAQEKQMGILAFESDGQNRVARRPEERSPRAQVLVSARRIPRRSLAGPALDVEPSHHGRDPARATRSTSGWPWM